MNKVTLFLMTRKGYEVLDEILSAFNSDIIDFIVVSEDDGVAQDYVEKIKSLAVKYKVRTVTRNDDYEVISKYAIAISWRWLISSKNSETRLIVLHDSLLPKYRGFAPLVNQLIQQEPHIGVTAFFANKDFDKGDIIEQQQTNITYPIKINEAIKKITPLYRSLTASIVQNIKGNRELKSVPQNDLDATYSLWRDEKDYEIQWGLSAIEIKRFVDAVGFPYLGASTKIKDRSLRIFNVEVEKDLNIVNRDVGKTLFLKEGYPVVVCGVGLLKITEAIYEDDNTSIFPIKKFRLRFS